MLHNIAIVDYVEGGGRDPRKLLGILEKLKQRLEDAKSEAESVEGGSLSDALSDADTSLTAYNTAVLQFQLKQYALCRTLLEDMFSNIEPIDELLAFKVPRNGSHALASVPSSRYLLLRLALILSGVLLATRRVFAAATNRKSGGSAGVLGA